MRGALTLWLLHVHQYLVKDPDPSPHYAYCLMFAQEKQWFLLESISNNQKFIEKTTTRQQYNM